MGRYYDQVDGVPSDVASTDVPTNAPAPQPVAPYTGGGRYYSPGGDMPGASVQRPVVQQTDVDPYRAAAQAEREKLKAVGATDDTSYGQRLFQGATLGWGDEALAAATTPLEMIKRGVNPVEAYRYTKAREDLINEETRKNTSGVLGAGAELLGGLATGGVAGAGAKMAVNAAKGYLPNWLKGVGIGAGYGAVAGAGNAPDKTDLWGTAINTGEGAALGGVLGGVLPPLIQGASYAIPATTRAITQYSRLAAPTKVADERLAQVMSDAGVTPQEVMQRVTNARAAGQTDYTVADAIGNEGIRAVTGQAKLPGEQRNLITETLVNRDRNIPQGVSDTINTGLGVNGTAQQATDALIARAGDQSAPLYRRAEGNPTWSNRLQEFIDDPIARAGLRQGMEVQRLRAVGEGRPYNPRDAMITDFDAAGDPIITGVPNMQTLNTLKTGLDRMIGAEMNPVTGALGARGAALATFKNGLLREMDAINPAYAEARAAYGEPMRIRNAVELGQGMVTRGRPGDTVPAFQALPPGEQQGVRIGYADKVLEPLERTGNYPAILRDKSPKGMAELDALSLYQGPRQPGQPDQLRQSLTRYQQMKEMSNKALGGSQTAENIADMNAGSRAVGDAANLVASVASGNKLATVQNLYGLGKKYLSGDSQAQRLAITQALLQRDPNMMQQMAERIALRQARADRVTRGFFPGSGGASP